MLKRRLIEKSLRETALSFGYQEVATPTFENAELFVRKSGSAILDQLYLFRDKSERELVLRPELTAPVIRFFSNELHKQPKPLKIFYEGSCFRYERPQKGRFREFWQFGAELIGTDSPEGIAELIVFATQCLTNAGLTNFELRVGYLEILKSIMNKSNIQPELQAEIMIIIDKGDLDSLRTELENAGLEQERIDAFLELVQFKYKSSEFEDRYKILTEQFPTIKAHLDRFQKVIYFLNIFGLDNYTIDLGIARGLDYYTGIVFEIDVPVLGAEKQVCGGGEYSLDELFNLKDTPCSGFAIGFDRVVLAYELEGVTTPDQDLDIFIIPLAQSGLEKAIEISSKLRKAGFKLDLDIRGRNMSKNLKFASSRGVKFVVFIGDNELKEGLALVRNMADGEQKKIKFEKIIEHFKNLI